MTSRLESDLQNEIAQLDEKIANWTPVTTWDKANQRSLGWLKADRNRKLKALERLEQRKKEHSKSEEAA